MQGRLCHADDGKYRVCLSGGRPSQGTALRICIDQQDAVASLGDHGSVID
jgi:hypothetical protein